MTFSKRSKLNHCHLVVRFKRRSRNALDASVHRSGLDDRPDDAAHHQHIRYPTPHTRHYHSRVDGPAREGDLISISAGALQTVEYLNDYPLYQRDWSDITSNLYGRDVPRPQYSNTVSAQHNFPACYQKSSNLTLRFGTSGTGQNNGVLVRCLLNLDLISGSTTTWSYNPDPIAFTPGTPFNVAVPSSLPNYAYKHSLKRVFKTEVVFSFDYERRVIYAYDAVFTPIYAVFDDPGQTFPNYHDGDDDTRTLKRKPWMEILDNAITHVTHNLTLKDATAASAAMARLTPDLYVYPSRPSGPGWFDYDPGTWEFYGYNCLPGVEPNPQKVRYDLWEMAISKTGDCRDFAAYLASEATSLGIVGVQIIRLGTPHNGGFDYNTLVWCGDPLSKRVYGNSVRRGPEGPVCRKRSPPARAKCLC